MQIFATLVVGTVVIGRSVLAQNTGSFEPTDFNITEALLDNGVNVSAIPALAGLVERSSLSACSIAVCSAPLPLDP